MRNLMLVATMMCLAASPCFAGENLDLYGTGSVVATVCGFENLSNGFSTNGFIDIKEDGWFSKVRVAKMANQIGLATELRSASGGYREVVVGPQLELTDNAGFVRANYWSDGTLSIWQQHTLSQDFWTNGWLDVKKGGQTNAELQIGYKVTPRADLVAEYRFGSARADTQLAIGVQFGLR